MILGMNQIGLVSFDSCKRKSSLPVAIRDFVCTFVFSFTLFELSLYGNLTGSNILII